MIHALVPPSPRPDRGAGYTEYAAVLLLVAAVAGVVITSGIPQGVGGHIDAALCRVSAAQTDEDCEPGSGGNGSAGVQGLRPDPGPAENPCDPLCEPYSRPGPDYNVEPFPSPPAAHPDDAAAADSAAQYDTVDIDDHTSCWLLLLIGCTNEVYEAHEMLAVAVAYFRDRQGSPDAADLLEHFREGSGETYQISGDKLVGDIPEFRDRVESDREDLGRSAVLEAQERGITEPTVFPLSTEWNAFGRDPANPDQGTYRNNNWWYALASFRYSLTGEVTVTPPQQPGGEWTYRVDTQVNIKKYYDWDPDDHTALKPPFYNASQWTHREMHRTGLAQEFWVVGQSRPEIRYGTL
ncbi:hypothetical protein ACFO4E_10110 [Nocardiopsis mangrovi]|uniref:Flp pilus-assembly TadG-like N-terminal domain-containing protein n=1 Tax=Nocardiopsis mangrovi TaxID=1179818 RepID=A0ABV9DW15_9ACTN